MCDVASLVDTLPERFLLCFCLYQKFVLHLIWMERNAVILLVFLNVSLDDISLIFLLLSLKVARCFLSLMYCVFAVHHRLKVCVLWSCFRSIQSPQHHLACRRSRHIVSLLWVVHPENKVCSCLHLLVLLRYQAKM